MMNREQTIRDLSAALSHAEENGVLGELRLPPVIVKAFVDAVDTLYFHRRVGQLRHGDDFIDDMRLVREWNEAMESGPWEK